MDESNINIEEETLPLDLTALQASILWINCNRSLEQYLNILKSLKGELVIDIKKRESKLDDAELRQQISEIEVMVKTTNEVGLEIGEIVKELDNEENTSKIIIKPNWTV